MFNDRYFLEKMNNSLELEKIKAQELAEHIKERAQEAGNEEELK